MRTILDFHIHSKYSRACSKQLELPTIAMACEKKGINIVATGDFTHPAWFSSIQEELTEGTEGIFKLKKGKSPTRFVLATELSCIYKHRDAVRRLHHIVLAPSLEAVAKLNKKLEDRGCNIRSDGRPILGLPSKDLLSTLLDIDERFELIPAHAWTPWFAVFGSKSGYNSLEECFEELTPRIHAIETGLSSDPPMNRRLSALDDIILVSNSDAHSPDKLGREANVFDMSAGTYTELLDILRGPERHKFLHTIEFYPEEGKYHMDGHRDCDVCLDPEESKRNGNKCPRCKKMLTLGVLHRVAELADRTQDAIPTSGNAVVPHKSIVPLLDLIASVMHVGSASKKVKALYDMLVNELGNEFHVLLDSSHEDIERVGGVAIAEGVKRMREGALYISPGYDGVFGTVQVLAPDEVLGPKQSRFV